MELHTHVQSLPQELYDMVLDMVFQAPSGKRELRCIVNRNYDNRTLSIDPNGLKLLSINRSTRALLARSYFDADFIYHDNESLNVKFVYYPRGGGLASGGWDESTTVSSGTASVLVIVARCPPTGTSA